MIAYLALAGLQLAGGYYASENMKEAAAINAEIAEMNAEFAELDAYDAKIDGESAKAGYQKVIDKTLAERNALAALGNIDLSSGTALALQQENEFQAEVNLMEIEKRFDEKALGYEREARAIRSNSYVTQANTEAKADSLRFQTLVGAAKTGITGYSKSASKGGSDLTDDELNELYWED